MVDCLDHYVIQKRFVQCWRFPAIFCSIGKAITAPPNNTNLFSFLPYAPPVMSLPAWIFLLCWFWFQQPRAALSQSLFNISTCMDWRVDFLPCKAKIRRHPDGWQGFLTQSGRKIRRQDMRGGDIKQALSVYQIKGFPGDDSWMAISDQILREFAGVLLLSFCNGICGIRLLQKDITCIPLVLQNTSNHTD